MSNETSPGRPALGNSLLQRQALRRAAEDGASGSPSVLETVLAQIFAHATPEAAQRQRTARKRPA